MWADQNNFGIIGGKGDPRALRQHIQTLRAAHARCDDIVAREALLKRIGKLLGGTATVWVGGITELQIEERLEAARRTAAALRSALMEGVVPGGGVAFWDCRAALQDIVPVPEIGPDDILMKVYAAGICGSDLLIQEDRHFYRAPVTQGHEFSGIAYQVGRNVPHIREGDKLVADIEIARGEWLGVTVDGALAPYMRLPGHVAYRVQEHVPLDHACLAEPIVAVHHLIQERAQVKVGDDVVVVGPGPMGLIATQYARLCGARCIILVGLREDEKRLAIGKQVGADYIAYSEDGPEKLVMEVTHGKGAEFVVECSASGRGVQHAIDCARKAYEGPGGKGVILFISLWGRAISVNLDQVSLGQLDIRGSWSWNGRETWEHAVDLLNRGVFNLGPVITGHYALDEWETAFANLRAKQDVKALIHPNGLDWAP